MKDKDTSVKMFQGAPPNSFQYSRNNRNNPTPAEDMLWGALRENQLSGYKFRRQHPTSYYILDFYCHSKKLAIEVDGGYHDNPDQKDYDEFRTAALNQMGITEIRFTNQQVLDDLPGVLERIKEALSEI